MLWQASLAGQSDRADHGPRGSWDGWVGLTAKALGSLGQYDAALNLTRVAGRVLGEGPFGQAHRVYGLNNTVMAQAARKGGDQAYLAICGGTIASAVIRTLFGFAPLLDAAGTAADPSLLLDDAAVPRGFDGRLLNVRYRDSLYTISSKADTGLNILKQQ